MTVSIRRGPAWVAGVLSATVLTGAVLTAPAAADPAGLSVVTTPSVLNSADKVQTASCPAGTVVSGGGGFLTSSSTASGHVAIDRLEPLDNGTGFVLGMREAGPTNFADNWRVNALATCVTAPAGYDVVAFTGAVETQYVTVSCGTKSVIGMGGRVDGGGAGNIVLDQVTVSGDLKTVTARGVPVQGGLTSGWTVTAFAVCATTPSTLQLIKQPSASGSPSMQIEIDVCPAGTALFSIGADIQGGNGQVLLTGLNVAPSDTVRVWAHEDADGWNPNWTLTSYGICG